MWHKNSKIHQKVWCTYRKVEHGVPQKLTLLNCILIKVCVNSANEKIKEKLLIHVRYIHIWLVRIYIIASWMPIADISASLN